MNGLNGYVLKIKDSPYTKWACEWKPSWKQNPDWASTGSIGEARVFDSPEAALAWAKEMDIPKNVEVWRFVLEPVTP